MCGCGDNSNACLPRLLSAANMSLQAAQSGSTLIPESSHGAFNQAAPSQIRAHRPLGVSNQRWDLGSGPRGLPCQRAILRLPGDQSKVPQLSLTGSDNSTDACDWFTYGDPLGDTERRLPCRRPGPRCTWLAWSGCPTGRRSSAPAAPPPRRSGPGPSPPWGNAR